MTSDERTPDGHRGIDAENLNDWFRAEIDGAVPPLRFELITGGHSNLTYRVEDAKGRVYVLRRPPTGAGQRFPLPG